MTLSGNELRALVTKAVRGLGFDWGRAKYLGESILLAERNTIPALTTLLELSSQIDPGGSKMFNIPLAEDVDFPVDAVDLGVALVDRLCILDFNKGTSFDVVGCPLLLGILCFGLTGTGRALRIKIANIDCVVQADRIFVSTVIPFKGKCLISDCKAREDGWRIVSRFEMSESDVATLDYLASLTYAPATDSSRSSGAGAGLIDND